MIHRIAILFFLLSKLYAQESGIGFSLKPQYGFIIPHSSGVNHLFKGHVQAFELSVFNIPNGTKKWHHDYFFPAVGITLQVGDLGNPDELGRFFSLYPTYSVPLIKKSKLSLNFRVGAGLVYLTKSFDIDANFKNLMIGSAINAVVNFSGDISYQISSKLKMGLGLNFTHFSNGAFIAPNLGINIPAATTLISYQLNNKQSLTPSSENTNELNDKIALYMIVTGAKRQNKLPDENHYPIWSNYINLNYHLSKNTQLMFCSDIYYNTSLVPIMIDRIAIEPNPMQLLQHGLSVMYGQKIARLTLYTGFGLYTYSKSYLQGPMYFKVGMNYKATSKILIHLALKSHFAVADFIDFGIGYKLWRK
jgi:hypothetical protein